MKIHCSEDMKACMSDFPEYTFEERGTVEIKVCLSIPKCKGCPLHAYQLECSSSNQTEMSQGSGNQIIHLADVANTCIFWVKVGSILENKLYDVDTASSKQLPFNL